MADELPLEAPPPPVAPATEPQNPAPSAGFSVSAPVVEAPPQPAIPPAAPAAAPVVPSPPAEVAAVETPAVVEPVVAEPPKPAPTLLSEAKPPEVVPEPVAVEPPPIVPPVYEPFTLPEGVQVAPERLTEYAETLGKFGVPQEAGQALIDMHIAELQRVGEQALERQHEAFAKTQDDWVIQTRSELGARYDTTLREAAFGRDAVLLNPAYGGSQQLLDSFTDLINFTGAGNNVTFIRAFAAIGRALAEPKIPNMEPQPSPDRGLGRSRAQSRYPQMTGGNGAG